MHGQLNLLNQKNNGVIKMNRENENKSPLSTVTSDKLLASLSDTQRSNLAKQYLQDMVKLNTHRGKLQIDRENLSNTLGILNTKTKDAIQSGSNITLNTTIKSENSETKVELKDPQSSTQQNKIYLYIFALIALVLIVFLLK